MTSRSGSTRLLNLHLSLTAPVVALSVHATGTDGAGAGTAAQMVTIMFISPPFVPCSVHLAAVKTEKTIEKGIERVEHKAESAWKDAK